MPRIACLLVPDFPIAALRRAEPDLHGRPLVAVEREDPHAPLTAVSAEAAALGARPGLSAAQARTISNALLVRRPRSEDLRCAEEALCDRSEEHTSELQSHSD